MDNLAEAINLLNELENYVENIEIDFNDPELLLLDDVNRNTDLARVLKTAADNLTDFAKSLIIPESAQIDPEAQKLILGIINVYRTLFEES